MEYAYATCLLHESDREINERNLTAVLEAAGIPIQTSRVRATVAALEDVDVGTAAGRAVEADAMTGSDPISPSRNGTDSDGVTDADRSRDAGGADTDRSGGESDPEQERDGGKPAGPVDPDDSAGVDDPDGPDGADGPDDPNDPPEG